MINSTENQKKEIQTNRSICGFWRRLIAFMVDGVILAVVGKGLGLLFGSIFAQMGGTGPLVGFGVYVLYFGILHSPIGKGQTLGKKLLKIRVVNARGKYISFTKALLRASIIGIFFCLSAVNSLLVSDTAILVNSILCIIVGAGIIYFYLFNRITRQSIHDLISRSFVVKADAEDRSISLTIWRKHYLIYSSIILILVIGSLFLYSKQLETRVMSMLNLQNELKRIDGVNDASVDVVRVTSLQDNRTADQLAVTVYVKRKPLSYRDMQNDVAKLVLEKYPVTNIQSVHVKISNGYDIGIAKSFQSSILSFTPGNWEKRIYAEEWTAF
jgi:uncharacterized RDD family membrane protein YckC